MNIECPGCGKRYRVDPRRVPASGVSVTCKQCDHVIKVASEASGAKRVIVCRDCAKQYRIDVNRIPADMRAARCKACGGTIPLVKDEVVKVASRKPVERSETPASEPESADRASAVTVQTGGKVRLFHQLWFLVTGIVVVVLLLAVCLWIVFNPFGKDDVSPKEPPARTQPVSHTNEVSESSGDGSPAEAVQVTPVAAVTLRVPALLQAVQGSTYLSEMPPQAQMAMVSLSALSLGSIDLFLCYEEDGALWPVLRVERAMARVLAGQFAEDGPLGPYFRQKDAYTFQVNESVVMGMLKQMLSARAGEGGASVPSEDELSAIPLEQYAVVLDENQIWLVPNCVQLARTQSPRLFEQAFEGPGMPKTTSKQDLLRISAHMPEDIHDQWAAWLLENEMVQAHAGAEVEAWVEMVKTPVTALLKSLSSLERVAVSLACPRPDQRRVTWAQRFKDSALAQRVYEQVRTTSAGDDLGGHPLAPFVVRLLNCAETQHSAELAQNVLTVTVSWSEQDDTAILQHLGQGPEPEAPQEVEPSASPGNPPVELAGTQDRQMARWLHAAGLTRHLDEVIWREQLPDRFVQALMPRSNNGFGVKDAVFLEVDTWGHNASLATVFYEVTQVTTPDGRVLNDCVGVREPMTGWRIRIPGRDGAQVGQAVIRFDVRVPSDLEATVLDVSGGYEVADGMGSGAVTLAKVADHAVRLTYRNMSMPSVYAFDGLGNRLRRERVARQSDGVILMFSGSVETCLVVGVRKSIAHRFETRVNVAPDHATTLSHTPEVPKYTRFDESPLVNYLQASSLDVNDLAVHWHQRKQPSHFEQVLSVALPQNVALQPTWDVYAHRRDRKMRLNGASVVDRGHASYRCRYDDRMEADEISGSVQFTVFGRIERVTFQKHELQGSCHIKVPRDTDLELSLDKNRLSYRVSGGHMVQLAAYDDQGRRLEQDPAWQQVQGTNHVYFWGVPDRVVLDVSTQTKVARLDFSVTESAESSSLPLYTSTRN